MSATDIRLNQPVIASGEARTFFFNGRLLSAEDLQREQGQREAGQRRLAQLIGSGIATGLGVTAGVGSTKLSITAGLGVTPSGEVIEVGSLEVDLQTASRPRRAGGFSACEAAFNTNALIAGLHLLVLTPTWISDGRAPTLLGDVGACNRNVELPAVRARLIKLNPPTNDTIKLRNHLAYALLGSDPLLAPGAADDLIGWWPKKVAPTLGRDDLPIAVVKVNDRAQVEFLDVDAARRRLAPPPGNAADALWLESRVVEMEAFARQFLGQINDIANASSGSTLAAPSNLNIINTPSKKSDAFAWLPPVVLLNKVQRQDYQSVFANTEVALPADYRSVNREEFACALRDGLYGEPIERVNAHPSNLLELAGNERWLLRLRPKDDPDDNAAPVIAAERNEHTSRRVASMAGRVLRNPDASSEERSLAASALTQTPDKATRKRTPRKPG